MSYGKITNEMEVALRPIVRGEAVYDLGAGDLQHARHLLRLGARHVVAIDKEPPRPTASENITVLGGYFDQVPIPTDGIAVAFVAWPINYRTPGLVAWLAAARVVVYLGHNFGGSSCGNPELFEHLLSRRLTGWVAHRANTLIVVDEPLSAPREPTPEEAAFGSDTVRHFDHYHPAR